jgi:hypothetical protein
MLWLILAVIGLIIAYQLGKKTKEKCGINIPLIKIMFTVKDDHPNVPYAFAPIDGATDAEGSPIPASEFSQSDFVSDAPSVVDVVDGENGREVKIGSPNADGSPALGNLVSEISYQGKVVKQIVANFTVTHGDPINIVGGGATFDGLTEDQ